MRPLCCDSLQTYAQVETCTKTQVAQEKKGKDQMTNRVYDNQEPNKSTFAELRAKHAAQEKEMEEKWIKAMVSRGVSEEEARARIERSKPSYYLMDEAGNVTKCTNLFEWAFQFDALVKNGKNVVETTELHDLLVSTVFLGVGTCSNHLAGIATEDFNYIFETMVFGDQTKLEVIRRASPDDITSIFGKVLGFVDIQQRYKTLAEAKEGHARMVEFINRVLLSRN
jgi:rubrerythrin